MLSLVESGTTSIRFDDTLMDEGRNKTTCLYVFTGLRDRVRDKHIQDSGLFPLYCNRPMLKRLHGIVEASQYGEGFTTWT